MNLREWLVLHELRQVDLAEKIGVSHAVISRTLTGRRRASANLRLAFARKFGMGEADALFGRNDMNLDEERNVA